VNGKMLIRIAFLACAAAAWSEVDFSAGLNGNLPLPEIEPAGVEPWVKAQGDFLFPLSDEASLLLDAGGRFGYALPGQLLNWNGSASGAVTWRGDQWFWKLGADAEAEGKAGSVSIDLASDLEVSLDLSLLTIAFVPTLRWSTGDLPGLGLEGGFSGIFAAGEEAVLRAALSTGTTRPGEIDYEWFVEGGIKFTWYSPALVVFSAEAAYKRNFAPASAVITADGVPVTVPSANGYNEAFVSPEVSASLGPGLLFNACVPARFRISDHGAIQAGSLTADSEWIFSVSPAASFRFDLSRLFEVGVSGGADIVFSNSPYREGAAAYFAIEGTLRLEEF